MDVIVSSRGTESVRERQSARAQESERTREGGAEPAIMRERDHLLQVEAAVCEKREAQDGKQPPLVRAEPPNVLNRSVHGHVRVGGAVAVAAPPRVRHRRRLQLRAPPRKQHGGGEHGASAGAGNARLRAPQTLSPTASGRARPPDPRACGRAGLRECTRAKTCADPTAVASPGASALPGVALVVALGSSMEEGERLVFVNV